MVLQLEYYMYNQILQIVLFTIKVIRKLHKYKVSQLFDNKSSITFGTISNSSSGSFKLKMNQTILFSAVPFSYIEKKMLNES